MSEKDNTNIFDVSGKVAVVTGGLGILGTEYSKTLASHGAKVAILDVVTPSDNHPLKEFFDQEKIIFLKTDITKRDEVESALSRIEKKWGTPNVLINNAAIDFPPTDKGEKELFENYSEEKWRRVLDVNITGIFITCQVFGGAMARAKRGSIINISSTYGLVSPDQRIYDNFIKPASYSVTKSGILNFTRYLAVYWAKDGVRVNTLSPASVFNNQPENFIKKYCERVPIGRMAERNEYNGAILFLASDASAYMTGSNLVIDGGWTAW